MMNGKLQWIAGVLCSAAFLAADTLLEVEPGTILGDRWNRNLHQNFSTGSSKTGVEAVSENGKTIARYQPGASTLYRLFGAESCGLPKDFYEKYADRLFTIPMTGPVRSLNLSSSAAITLFEALRQNRNSYLK